MPLTILSHNLDGHRIDALRGLREECANFSAPHNGLDSLLLHAVAYNNADASVQGPGRCLHLGVHAASADLWRGEERGGGRIINS